MELFHTFTILISLTAAFGYINHRFLRLPATIGVMVIALITSLLIVAIGSVYPEVFREAREEMLTINFSDILMEVMLSFLLFAGALHVDNRTLASERMPIILFATLGVVTSTFVIGGAMYYLLMALELNVPFIHCLLFGALISPTDPIAVLGILKKLNVPRSLEVKIAGESLFNDGVAVVVFLSVLRIARLGPEAVTAADIAVLFLEEAVGGVVFGLALGYLGYRLLRSIDAYTVEVLITLAMVMGGYALATFLHLSGPLAMVVAGLIVGNKARSQAMSDVTQEYLDKFWELIDEILNAVLFVLIGLEVLILPFETSYVIAGLLAIGVVLIARLIAVGLPISLMRLKRSFIPRTIQILTWGGLRGGISVALALSLEAQMSRDVIVSVTYIVVIFSIIVQGLTIGSLVKKIDVEEPVNSGH
jgi:monovalent cation:H+ antiporter, CPA1 family